MASSSKSTQPNAKNDVNTKYDVIIIYEGKDLTVEFMDLLYEDLIMEGLSILRDGAPLLAGKGQEPILRIKGDIIQSRASIVILSKNFTKSVYCLETLSIILEEYKKKRHLIFLMYYNFTPQEVQTEVKNLKIEVAEGTKWTTDDVDKWKENLTYVATILKQIEYSEEVETNIKNLIMEISSKLKPIKHGMEGKHIGKLFVSTEIITKRENGTVVYKGFYENRKVAVEVKSHVDDDDDSTETEFLKFMVVDSHQNIIRWYCREMCGGYDYIAFQHYDCTLADVIQKNIYPEISFWRQSVYQNVQKFYPSSSLLDLMKGIVAGLKHLHKLKMTHGKLDRHNVLIVKEKHLCAKLGGFGNNTNHIEDTGCHSTDYGETSFQTQVDEDMHNLHNVLEFCMTKDDRSLVHEIPEAKDLCYQLLDREHRPKASVLLRHPLFWNLKTRLGFFCDTSNSYMNTRFDPSLHLDRDILNIETSGFEVFPNGRWDAEMDENFMKYMNAHKPYNGESLKDLLLLVRNIVTHYHSFPEDIKSYVGSSLEEVDDFFRNRFPNLLLVVMKVQQARFHQEGWFDKYNNI